MKILLLRHGESESNSKNTFTGSIDIDLSELGLKQCNRAADYIVSNYKVDKIYSSPLIRAYTTAKCVADKVQKDIIVEDDLQEFYAGDWEGMKLDEISIKYKDDFDIWVNDLSKAHPPNGQTMLDFYNIKSRVFDKIINDNKYKSNTILIVSHVLSIMNIICYISKNNISELKNIPYFPNASLFDIDYTENTNKYNIIKFGFTDYLKNMITSSYDNWK